MFEIVAEKIESLDEVKVSENCFFGCTCTSLDVEETEEAEER